MNKLFGWYMLLSLALLVAIGVFTEEGTAFGVRLLIFVSWALLAIGIIIGRNNEKKSKDT